MQDDLESLGYAFLEMLQKDLPWDLTKDIEYEHGDYFSQEQLSSMADKRDREWEALCADKKIPTFLITWQQYVRSLGTFDIPSYAWLLHLIQHSQDKPTPQTPVKRRRDSAAEEGHKPASAKRLKDADCLAPEE